MAHAHPPLRTCSQRLFWCCRARRDAIHRLFQQYKEEGGEAVGVEGITQLCEDLKVAPDDIVVLVLRWAEGGLEVRSGSGLRQGKQSATQPGGGAAGRRLPA